MPRIQRLSKKYLRQAEEHLSRIDRVMAQLISIHGECRISTNELPPFHNLASSIIGQQLSAKAAQTIRHRISEISSHPFSPEIFLDIDPKRLRAAGLSGAKAKYIRELSRHVIEGRLDFVVMNKLDDESVISKLLMVPGIGRWTAEMFLIFGLKRPNVMAFGDAGLQRAAKMLYGKRGLSQALMRRWTPYCSVASWYLWRHLDAVPSKD